MNAHQRVAALSFCLALVACNQESTTQAGNDDPNAQPTGSIQVKSLCNRVLKDDLRVSHGGADSFVLRWVDDHLQVVYTDASQRVLQAVRVGFDGHELEAPVVIAETGGSLGLPSLVRHGDRLVVAWQELDGQATVRVRGLGLDGRPMGEAHVVATGRSQQMRPVLADTSFGLAVAWMDQAPLPAGAAPDIGDSMSFIAMLDDELLIKGGLMQVNPGSRQGYPWLIGGDKLALLWSDDMTGETNTYAAIVGPELSMPTPTPLRDHDATSPALLGRIGTTSAGYLAAWEDLRSGSEEIYMAFLDGNGGRHGGGLVEEPGTGSANWPQIAWSGVQGAIAYYQFRNGRPQIFLTFIDAEGQRVGGAADAQISNTPARARFPDIVWTGEGFAVIWIDARDGQTELYFNKAVCDRPAPI